MTVSTNDVIRYKTPDAKVARIARVVAVDADTLTIQVLKNDLTPDPRFSAAVRTIMATNVQDVIEYAQPQVAVTAEDDVVTEEPVAETGAPKAKTRRAPQTCQCGCGGTTNGGDFLPGHDARHKGQLLIRAERGDGDAIAEMTARGWDRLCARRMFAGRVRHLAELVDVAVDIDEVLTNLYGDRAEPEHAETLSAVFVKATQKIGHYGLEFAHIVRGTAGADEIEHTWVQVGEWNVDLAGERVGGTHCDVFKHNRTYKVREVLPAGEIPFQMDDLDLRVAYHAAEQF